MAREGIYVGSKEIIQRYVGTRLVWEKVTIQFDEILRFTSNRFGSFWRFWIYRKSLHRLRDIRTSSVWFGWNRGL